MRIIGKSGPYIVFLFTLIPVYLWLPFALWTNLSSTLRSIGQVTALCGTVLFCINFILATRLRFIENMFMGLNRVYIIHHLTGAVGFILLIFHPTFLILNYANMSIASAIGFITPSPDNIPVLLGTVSFTIMTLLLLFTFFINLEYDTWKKTHIWLGVPLLLAGVHAFIVGSTLDQSPVLKTYIIGWFTAAILAFAYRIWTKYIRAMVLSYTVSDVTTEGAVTIISAEPVRENLRFEPGQFMFVTADHRGIPRESHPFSITSPPSTRELTFAAKSLGDYTETLKLLEKGTPLTVEGPYGRFSYRHHNSMRFVWVAGGIGVTPFVSMLSSLGSDNKLVVDFYYCVRDEREAVYLHRIRDLCTKTPNVKFTLWTSANFGRFDASKLSAGVPDLFDATIFLCGPPPMMTSLKQQLTDAGVKKRRIITEEFSIT